MPDDRMTRDCDRHKRFEPDLGWDEFKDPQITDWKRVRGVIEHENALVNNRITWLLASHGFLFTILGLSANNDLVVSCFGSPRLLEAKDVLVATNAVCDAYKFNLLPLLMLLGLVISLIIAVTISHAEQQVRAMNTWWDGRYGSTVADDSHPAVFRPRPTSFLGFLFRYSLLASVFAATWGAGLLYVMVRRVDAFQAFFGGIAPIWYVLAMQLAILSWYVGCGRAETDSPVKSKRVSQPQGRSPRGRRDWYFWVLVIASLAFLALLFSGSSRASQGCFGLAFTILSVVLLRAPRRRLKTHEDSANELSLALRDQGASGTETGHH